MACGTAHCVPRTRDQIRPRTPRVRTGMVRAHPVHSTPRAAHCLPENQTKTKNQRNQNTYLNHPEKPAQETVSPPLSLPRVSRYSHSRHPNSRLRFKQHLWYCLLVWYQRFFTPGYWAQCAETRKNSSSSSSTLANVSAVNVIDG